MEEVTFIGFGEAAQAFAGDQAWRGAARAYDLLTDDPSSASAKHADYERLGVTGAASAGDAVVKARLVLSLVTADQALAAAEEAARYLARGAIYCDMNSVAPATKQAAAQAIVGAGAHYVDVAVLAPAYPSQLGVPLLLSGPEALAAEQRLRPLGFSRLETAGDAVGAASAVKMIRSVMVKGIEALTAECVLAAESAGVTRQVLASLDAGDKPMGWAERANYNLERMLVHGLRRAAEMEEVAKTLDHLGVEPAMTRGAILRQRQLGSLALRDIPDDLAGKVVLITSRKERV